MYEIINEKLRVYSVNAKDLPLWVKDYISLNSRKNNTDEFAVFYDKYEDKALINEVTKTIKIDETTSMFDFYEILICKYLEGKEKNKRIAKENAPGEMIEVLNLLDQIIDFRARKKRGKKVCAV